LYLSIYQGLRANQDSHQSFRHSFQFLHEIVFHHDSICLIRFQYVAKEEKLDATLQKKLNDTNVKNPNLFVSDYLPGDVSEFDFVFIDSVNKMELQPNDLEELKTKFPNVSFIYVFQTTKEGNFRGSNHFQHDVDVVIEIPEKGKAVQNGRFNQGARCRYLMRAEVA
jgi:predicted ATP-dependent serine protease